MGDGGICNSQWFQSYLSVAAACHRTNTALCLCHRLCTCQEAQDRDANIAKHASRTGAANRIRNSSPLDAFTIVQALSFVQACDCLGGQPTNGTTKTRRVWRKISACVRPRHAGLRVSATSAPLGEHFPAIASGGASGELIWQHY